MTNHFVDMVNADVVMILGSNAAENHPIATKWVQRAHDGIPWSATGVGVPQRRKPGSIILSADPRFTRTSAFAHHYAKFRSGTDIAFVGGMIHYAIERNRIQRDYLLTHTNAAFLVQEGFGFDDGLFTGFTAGSDGEPGQYDKASWAYELDANGIPARDPTLQHPRCVFQLLKKHFSRYDVPTVCSITGTPEDDYLRLCDIYTTTHTPDRVGTWLYAMGTTQHTTGTQNIRTYAILQLLLGNVGLAGGGVNALRGESNVQGSTDHALLFHILPGYQKVPTPADGDLTQYLQRVTPTSADPRSANWWQNYPKYTVSLLKAWWGDHAQKDTAGGFCFHYLPKVSGNYSHISLFEEMGKPDGQIKGLILLGQNPAVGGPNANRERQALHNLEWMIAVDLWDTETASFWRRPGVDPATVQTEVFMLPAASSVEKEGSITGSGRWAQWRYKAVDPPGDAKSDAWILDRLIKELTRLYKEEGGALPEPIVHLQWNYENPEHPGEPDSHLVAMEINGYEWRSNQQRGPQIASFAKLADDGSTCSGNWLYCGSYVEYGAGSGVETSDGPHIRQVEGRKLIHRMAKRFAEDLGKVPPGQCVGLHLDWAWCWPVNRRILYNRASCDATGQPYSPDRYVIKYVGKEENGKWVEGKWVGDVPDGGWPPLKHPDGSDNPAGRYSFLMKPDGQGALFSADLVDGPFPEHYEPLESPVLNRLSHQERNPIVKVWRKEEIGDPTRFPIVATTYRLSEHWQAGQMTRNLPWLVECMPNAFVELGSSLAKRKGIRSGDVVIVETARGTMEAYALVTERFEPFHCGGQMVDQIGIPWHWGYVGLAKGESANRLTPHVGDANTMIPEYKAFLCDIHKKEV
jgi:formate dehydrogenase-N alpha subunit